ncbi:MAG: hypothetical protein QQW96_01365 [Tychonema bourrellyi B0820]|nr:hypothetical protein [Tychonema bourrellyi B0820]
MTKPNSLFKTKVLGFTIVQPNLLLLRLTLNSQQSTVNSQQSTVNSQQLTVNSCL